jgi:hypothetical protein
MTKTSSTWDNALRDFRPLIIAQGEVGYAYNLLQDSFFRIFMFALAIERPKDFARQPEFYTYALDLWHVFQNDKLQRQLALTTIEKIPTQLDIKSGIERLQWARKVADQLAEYRNLIAHTPVTYSPKFTIAGPANTVRLQLIPQIGGLSTKPVHSARLSRIKTVRFWKALRNDLLNLNDYVEFVGRQLWWREYERQNGKPIVGASRAWPRKPRLPCARRIDQLEGRRSKTKRPKSPRGPPPPLRGPSESSP